MFYHVADARGREEVTRRDAAAIAVSAGSHAQPNDVSDARRVQVPIQVHGATRQGGGTVRPARTGPPGTEVLDRSLSPVQPERVHRQARLSEMQRVRR